MIGAALLGPKVIGFFAKWGLPILAALLAVGLGLGFWMYVGEINSARRDAEAKVVRLEAENKGLVSTAKENAVEIGNLTVRLDAEQTLAQTRLDSEQARRTAAEDRYSKFAGALDGLRKKLEPVDCGIGPGLSDSLRDSREAREADRRSREGSGK
tara:strand:+ start:335 stop:799 length:465 start_codon:yes stop_codon:yes gene_type:complete